MATSNTTAWVLQAALQGLSAPSGKDFISAAQFFGAKPGYVFKTGDHGLGYYLDTLQKDATAGGAADGAGPGGNADGRGGGAQPSQQAPQQQLDPEELLRQAEEEANIDQIQALDAKSLRRLVAGLEKKYKENMALRLKYSDQPDKFLDSEVDLDEHIKSLLQVAGSPELYPVLLDGPCLSTLLALLSHENTDIAADVVELLAEMTGADAAEEYGEEARALVEGLVEHNAPELLVQRLLSFKEDVEEEARAVHNCLAVVENMVEIQPDLAATFVEKTKLLTWLLRRLKRRDFDTNKQYASEVLAILMQGSVSNQARLGAENGIDLLLTCVAQYKSKDPSPGEEEEYMQNCFDVLCACLMQQAHKAAFVKAEGVELMQLMLQSRRQCRYGALKCLDYATSRFAVPAEKLVDLGGLKQLFGLFMGKSKVKGPTGEHDVDGEVEERCVSLVSNLVTQLPAAGRGASRRERLLAKFVENEFEKTDRLMELLFRYQSRVRAEERRLADALAEAEEDEQVDEDELLLARMDAGLFTLQQCCVILGNLWATGDVGLRKRLLALLHQKGQPLGPVREVLLEYYNSIGEEGGPEEAAKTRSHVRGLLESLGAQLEEEKPGPAGAQAAQEDGLMDRQQRAGDGRTGGRRGATQRQRMEDDGEEGEADAMELDEGPVDGGVGRRTAPPLPPLPPPLPDGDGELVPPLPPSFSGRPPHGRAGDGGRKNDSELMPPPPPPNGTAVAAAASKSKATDREGRGSKGGGGAAMGASEQDRAGGRDRRDLEAEEADREDRRREDDGATAAGPLAVRERERDRERDSRLDRDRDRDRERERERQKEREKERERAIGKEKDKDKDKERERERDRDRERREAARREREADRDEQDYDDRRKRDKDRDREGREKDREREREREKDRSREKDRDRERERERDRYREKERDRR
ncbi:hypothetical protein Vretimale_6066 [Volvox reticuliferus]|uniref:Beta-catenin-like protein 1 N-terminal domain-containing protein n=1 Tax=Volvox reticuliferus TaxID=1737510 RepID=A0A8J4D0J8_9CHLO|nr:hypothetical protein Vretifemale_20827 [Volvox reticuliferus]GIM01265.1 hypothetical protein Vretimale_6066 [Volvox reticuliferus]